MYNGIQLDLEKTLRSTGLEIAVEQAVGRHGPVQGIGVTDHGSAVIQLSRGSMQQTYFMAFGPRMTFGAAVAVAAPAHLPLLIASDHISDRTSGSLRAAGIQYFDTSGNASIRFAEVLIDVRGRKRVRTAEAPQRNRVSTNPFSPRRAQVVCVLLAWPQLVQATTRDVARTSGVSVGQAHEAMRMLGELGHLLPKSPALHRPHELLENWAAAYPTGLGPRLALASFHGAPGVTPSGGIEDQFWIGGESAIPQLIRPVTMTLYVESLDPALPLANRWRSDGPPNVLVRRKFWSTPQADDERVGGIPLAPWPLVYADLMASDDPRQREVAAEWRDRHAGPDQM